MDVAIIEEEEKTSEVVIIKTASASLLVKFLTTASKVYSE